MSQSEVVVPPAAAAPAAAPAAIVPAVVPVPVAVAPASAELPTPPPGTDAWLTPRLARERANAFKSAGFESEADAKAAAESLKAQREAEKATSTKLAERETELAVTKTRAQQLEDMAKETAGRMLFGLTDAQKAAVSAVAGEDPAAQVRAIIALTPTWAKEAAAASVSPVVTPAASAPPAVTPAPVTTPAPTAQDTAPGRVAPAGGDTSPVNHKATYDTMADTNPFAAARYGLEHDVEVYKTPA